MSSKFIYYVYAYLRSKDSKTSKAGTPYYIGKGKHQRAYDKGHTTRPPSNKSNIILLETGLTNIGAMALERRLIKWWGRVDLGTGILRNRTDGGEGCDGRKMSNTTRMKISASRLGKSNGPHSAVTIDKIRKANTGRKFSEEFREKIRRAKAITSDETRKRMSESHKGYICSDETRKKLSVIASQKRHSIETRNKMSAQKKGVPRTEEEKAKMRGIPKSDDHRAKLSELRRCKTLYKFSHIEFGIRNCTRHDLLAEFPECSAPCIGMLCRGAIKNHRGWTILG